MFNKLKRKIKLKLTSFLEIDNLEETFNKYKNKNDRDIFNHEENLQWCSKKLENHDKQISQFDNKIESIHNTVENVVHIGTDVRRDPYENHSWAIVCIEGKMNIVKFVDLNGRNSMEILRYLKQFEGGRHCIDTPCQQMFYQGLWKF